MNQAVALKQDGQALAPLSETSAIIHMIERAARDPAIDMDKMDRLLQMHERILDRDRSAAFDAAMSQCQGEMRPVAADANNPQTKSKYASYFALDTALRPVYSKHGFALSFNTGDGAPENHVRVLCRVSCGGHGRDYHVDMPADGKGAKGGDVMTKTHAVGSALTYGQRYLLKMIFNIAVGGDDDGNGASDVEAKLSKSQVDSLTKLIEDTGGNVAKFCAFAKVETIGDIFANRYDAAVAAVNRAAADRKAKQEKQS